MNTPDGQRRCRIRLFPDYAGTVLWLGDPIGYEATGLDAGLISSLQAWEESYYRSLTPDFQWISPEAARQFTAEGNRLAQLLANELGEDYEISFNSYEDGVPHRVFQSSGTKPNSSAVAAFNTLAAARQARQTASPGTSESRPAGKDDGWFAWSPLADSAFPPSSPRNDGE
ncbi:hypothetical protein ITX31_01075 [Arthrobacter gandavensis]|uniref:hypothetical protein n=1 Tax=Arthrobacter gandavensis TaxID=169960 RepID=UPI00189006B7|nr:hypothetical protein [Arthrobacter gandavensis]MBF4992704.1 hypothetical protein [Arthrobacter gandavensis]